MVYRLYSIRDYKSGFSLPLTEQNDAVALRNFENAINVANSIYNTHPKDFALYGLGTFDTDTGLVDGCVPPDFICDGVSLLHDDYKRDKYVAKDGGK